MALRDTFNTIAPGLATDPLADDILAIAAGLLEYTVWLDKYELGVAYLAAHMLAISRRAEENGPGGGGSGPVTGARAGEVSVQFGQSTIVSKDMAYYGTTPYGLIFLNLMRMVPGTKMFTTAANFFDQL